MSLIGRRTSAFNWHENHRLWTAITHSAILIIRISELTKDIWKKIDPHTSSGKHVTRGLYVRVVSVARGPQTTVGSPKPQSFGHFEPFRAKAIITVLALLLNDADTVSCCIQCMRPGKRELLHCVWCIDSIAFSIYLWKELTEGSTIS